MQPKADAKGGHGSSRERQLGPGHIGKYGALGEAVVADGVFPPRVTVASVNLNHLFRGLVVSKRVVERKFGMMCSCKGFSF
jgi:hypothetical protein